MGKKRKGKTPNPRNIPRTQADCDREWERGVLDGCTNASAMFLTVLGDKFGMETEEMIRFWEEVGKISEEVKEGRVSVADLRVTLREERGIHV